MTTQLYVSYGIGIVAFLLSYIAFKLDGKDQETGEQDYWILGLKIMLLVFVFAMVMLIPKTYMDFNENCYAVVDNSTITNVGGGVTTISNDYTTYCDTKDVDTPNLFYIWYMRLIRFMGIWAFLYFLYIMFYERMMSGFRRLGWLK